mgnify:CR=1 FL=1
MNSAHLTFDQTSDRIAERVVKMRSSAVRDLFAAASNPNIISLSGGMPDVSLLPQAAIRKATRAACDDERAVALQYGSTDGRVETKRVFCDLMRDIGVRAKPENIMITTGAQEALDLIAKTFVNPGDIVLAEGPTYLGALQAFCSAQGVQLAHVKPHGQLYNHAAIDSELAAALAQAVRDVDPKLVLVGLANSALVDEGRKLGLVTAEEFFADRNYTDEGRLVSRNDPAALIRDEQEAIDRVKHAIREGGVLSVTGKLVDLHPDTLCVHGDSPSALAFVSRIRQELEQDDIVIKAVGAE